MEYGKISVIMGIYNCSSTLSQAIHSIINQTYKNWELIMCDDGSTDNTYEIANYYSIKYPRKIIIIRNETNKRLAYSLNHCLKYAKGYYIARMDADDISLPSRFEKQISYLVDNPDCDLVGTAMQRFNNTHGLADIIFAANNPNYYTLRKTPPFHHATILCYKRVYDMLGGYTVDNRTNRAQDYDLWFRFYYSGFRGDNLKEPLYLVREDHSSIRRRTSIVRWNAFKTTCYGFKLLGYPRHWIIRPAMEMIIKSLVPFFLYDRYRNFQSKRKKHSAQ